MDPESVQVLQTGREFRGIGDKIDFDFQRHALLEGLLSWNGFADEAVVCRRWNRVGGGSC